VPIIIFMSPSFHVQVPLLYYDVSEQCYVLVTFKYDLLKHVTSACLQVTCADRFMPFIFNAIPLCECMSATFSQIQCVCLAACPLQCFNKDEQKLKQNTLFVQNL
jgi:hypothetical protein